MTGTNALPVEGSVSTEYEQRQSWILKLPRGFALIALVLIVAVAMGLAVGAVPIPLLSWLIGTAELSGLEQMVFTELRMPRVALAMTVGASLAVSGVALQGLFRNPLAEPQLIGVSSGAALGAIAMIVLGSRLALPEHIKPYSVSLAAVVGALVVVASLYALASKRSRRDVSTMLLLGIAINAVAVVGIGFFTWMANDGQLRELTFWTLGSFGSAQWTTVVPTVIAVSVAGFILASTGGALDRLQLGELEAARMGVSVASLKKRLVFAVAIGVGASVAVSGVIGFVGLVVPHIARMLVGVHHSRLFVGAGFMGASLAVVADLVARTLVTPAEMPVGLITSALGAPFFLWLIVRANTKGR